MYRLFKLFSNKITEYEKETRVYLIREITRIIIDNNIEDKNSILTFLDVDGKFYDQSVEILNDLYEQEIPENELNMLDRTISNQLKYSAIVEKSDKLNNMLTNIRAEAYDDLETAICDLGQELDDLNRDIKGARESIENSKHDLNMSSNGFVNALGKLIDNERNPSSKIKTGIQYLNTMFNGGLEKGRLYCGFGVAKGWKSGFMLNVASMAKRYNSFKTSDPSLKPVIVYLTLENTVDETVLRLWNHCFGDDDRIEFHDKVEAARMFETAGIFTPNDPSSAEIQIWYRPNRSISTADLNIMIEDLKKENKECVFLVVDYLKRIRAAESNKEVRFELANVTNELKTIAIEHNIPVLTATQLNIRPL